jgi:hypothetical protein
MQLQGVENQYYLIELDRRGQQGRNERDHRDHTGIIPPPPMRLGPRLQLWISQHQPRDFHIGLEFHNNLDLLFVGRGSRGRARAIGKKP